jgi:hypothetical protein
MAASYINQNIANPEKRGEYLRLLQTGQIPKLQKQFALQSQAHMAEMDKVNAEIRGRANAAGITAKSYNYAADKNAETALLQQDKLKLDFLQSQAQRSADLAKQLQANMTANPMWITKEGKNSPEYKAAAKAAADAQKDATESLTQLREFAQQPRTGKKPTAPGTPAPATPGRVVVTEEELMGKPALQVSAPQAVSQAASAPPPASRTYRVVQGMGGDDAFVMLPDGTVSVRSKKLLESYGFKPE